MHVGGASLWIVADKVDEETAAAWDYITLPAAARIAVAVGGRDGLRAGAHRRPRPRAARDDVRDRSAIQGRRTTSCCRESTTTRRATRRCSARSVRCAPRRRGAMAAIFDGADPQTALTDAADASNLLIASYNDRN